METDVNEDWRITKKTLKDRLQFFVDNDFASDVRFLLRNGDQVYAHKFILSVSSPVFASMFHGPLATGENVINIANCDDKEAFVDFLKYLYHEECNLNWENVACISNMAKTYQVSSLVDKCTEFLSQGINTNNVLITLQQAVRFAEIELQENCVNYICPNAMDVLKTDYFVKLDLETLKVILKQDRLLIKETELFKLIHLWCNNKLGGVEEADITTKRKLLGDALYLIRFPVMSAADFAENCVQSGYLIPEECCNILSYIARKTGCGTENEKLAQELISPLGFSPRERLTTDIKCPRRSFSVDGEREFNAWGGHSYYK